MKVSVRSSEIVKPRPLKSKTAMNGEVDEDEQRRRPPFKLCFLDQVTPPYYTPLVLFYPLTRKESKIAHWSPELMSKNLKESLSRALDSFYPLSGRVKDNAIVDDFEAGVPFVETRIQGHRVSEFLDPPKLEFLNKLLPVEPCCRHTEPGQLPPPQVTVQMNTFDCGGIAIGLCFYHQTMDGATISTFLETWAAHSRQLITPDDSANKIAHVSAKDLSGGYSTFPPPPSGVPPQYVSLIDTLWFPPEKNTAATAATTRRFVISNRAIATLKSRATGIENPTRTEAILAFVWKSMLAAAADSESPKPSCLCQAVNLRSRMKKKNSTHGHDLVFSPHSIGNLFSVAVSFCDNPDDDVDDDVDKTRTSLVNTWDLAVHIRGGVKRLLDEKWLGLLSSEQGAEMVFEGMKQLRSGQRPFVSFSSWIGFGFGDVDFGWGTPAWSGVVGEASGNNPIMGNTVLLKELAPKGEEINNGVELWMRVDPVLMASLEKNPQFLEMASPNPPIVF
ncbi:unnamed protein product [Linum tenue]|uniref:Uncharacterized protein n=1 Tax=Linum tenue TaxID=586396 RepID=A0AAV0JMA4_9ROSI|nr:unnamed protein product [Linum tenue]